MKQLVSILILYLCLWPVAPAMGRSMDLVDRLIAQNAGKTGVYVLERGEDALLARAWLADHARASIEVQYFIWSTDNIGILASEALLRAAQRGVHVRVIVDDVLIDAPDKSLLALALHPNIEIRIYNPKHSVGTPLHKRVLNVFTDFRGVNQRMHNKTFIVDGKVAITGGRNMADEYYDYDHTYNFRDRDVLLLGAAAGDMRSSFEEFWQSRLSVPVEDLYDGLGLMQKNVSVNSTETQNFYTELHAYARSPDNFAPGVRAAIESMSDTFPQLTADLIWDKVEFISDAPGKNSRRLSLGGGGRATEALAALVAAARHEILIQSPYLVVSDEALRLFRQAMARGVRLRVSTNSLASTDNLQAFSGYRNQRRKLLAMGMEIFEYKPDPAVQLQLMQRVPSGPGNLPVFALHAKSMVVDSEVVYIGTFNLDPRSENLNTEAGVIIRNNHLAHAVKSVIETDMLPANSWDAARDQPDQHVTFGRRSKTRFWQMMPIKPLL